MKYIIVLSTLIILSFGCNNQIKDSDAKVVVEDGTAVASLVSVTTTIPTKKEENTPAIEQNLQ